MNLEQGLYRTLRVMRAAKAVRKGRTGAYAKRAFKSWAAAKVTGPWRTP